MPIVAGGGPAWTSLTSRRPPRRRRGEELRALYVALTRAQHRWSPGGRPPPDAERARRSHAPSAGSTRPQAPCRDDSTTARRSQPSPPPCSLAASPRKRRPARPVSGTSRALERGRARSRPDRLTATSTSTGRAPATAASPTRPTRPSRRSRSRRSRSTRRRRSTSPTSPLAAVDAALAVELPLGAVPGGARRGHPGPRRVGAHRFRGPRPHRRAGRAARGGGRPRMLAGPSTARRGPDARRSSTPLGPSWGGLRLRDIPARRPARRARFDFPLAGGDHPGTGLVTMAAIAAVFAALPATTRSPPTTTASATPCSAPGAGLPHRQHRPRRPCRRPPRGRRLQDQPPRRPTATCRSPGTTAPRRWPRPWPTPTTRCRRSLYVVALHRYLRWRLAGYDPDAAPRRRRSTSSCAA